MMRLSILTVGIMALLLSNSLIFSLSAAEADTEDEEIEEIEITDDVEDLTEVPRWDSRKWSENPDAFPSLDRGVNVPTARTTKKYHFLFIIDHRANQPFTDNTWRDFFGLDSGSLKIGLGLRFGILDNLDVGIYRLNGTKEIFDSYELDLKYQFINQQQFQVDMAIRGGVTWFYQPDIADAVGGYGQFMIDREFWDRLLISADLLFHSESSYDSKRAIHDDWSLAAGGLLEIRILDFLAWNAEIMAPVAGFGASYPGWSSAVKFITSQHTFSLVVANTQYISADGIVSGSDRDFTELIIGFQITRDLSIF